jgi:2-polyprenyl-3-methyl-5-hydroxy-6-metoxy-1,4-benzoquinol methylase
VGRAIPTAAAEAWQAFFAHPAYVRFVREILDEERTAREVAAVWRLLELEAGTRVLDLGCGYGRVSVPLARRGCIVTGVDASEPMLELAEERARAGGVAIDLVHCDMREIDAPEEFDAVLSLGTALGYVEAEQADAAALAAAGRSLVAGGRLLIDTENREPKVRMAPTASFDIAGTTVRSERRYDHLTGRWHERMSWADGAAADAAEYSLRLYTAVELKEMLEAVGLTVDGLWGDFEATPFSADAARTVIRAVKR